MKAKELRIGNLVLRSDGYRNNSEPIFMSMEPYEVEEVNSNIIPIHDYPDFKGCYDVALSGLAGIPLTEDWLLKFGATKTVLNETAKTFDFQITLPDKRYERTKLCIAICFEEPLAVLGSAHITRKIKFVHQLQNLYFALTGEELTIKP